MKKTNTSEFVGHEPCPKCGSQDNLARYTDGHGFCFGCQYYEHGNDTQESVVKDNKMEFIEGESSPLNKRKITQETVEKWGYKQGTYKGKKVHLANYRDIQGNLVAQKVRFPNKDFLFIGDTQNSGLYGQHLWRDGGKMVVVTEGELDALSVSQIQGNKWPVVSVPNGSAGAKKALAKQLEWLEKFESVILMFDNDEAGLKAVDDCVTLFSPGRVKIAKLPLKDASEMLQSGRSKEVIEAIWEAKVFRPDGIVDGKDLWDLVSSNDVNDSIDYPYPGLNSKTMGIRKGEIVCITAGSGIGKSQVCREIAYHMLLQDKKVGYIALEESNKRTALGFISLYLNRPIHLQNVEVNDEDLKDGFENTLGTGNLYFYDHWGSMDVEHLLSKIRYMVRGLGCEYIILDHISIVVSGMEGGDERRMIDNAMTKLRSLTEEVQCGMILVSHLRRPSGDKGHEDGAKTSLAQLRGSHSLGQLSDIVLGCERNQQGEDPDVTKVRVLKNRWTGETGIATQLHYSKSTGRMTEVEFTEEEESNQDF
tara:strand:+ start:2273 stop:3877 length:1605 start_codon:yes stop_codon:yes gene_type:complete